MEKKKVLIVDDDEQLCELIRLRFEHEGFDVRAVHDESGFRSGVFSERPDIVILDIMLGEEKGPELYRKMLIEGMERDIPVIFLTSLLEDGNQSPVKPGRTHGLYRKPVDIKQLISDIKECCFA